MKFWLFLRNGKFHLPLWHSSPVCQIVAEHASAARRHGRLFVGRKEKEKKRKKKEKEKERGKEKERERERKKKREREREREIESCLLYTSPSPRDATLSRMPSSA